MLIEKKLSVGDVVSLKLLSGEELIGKLKSMGETILVVSKPLVITIGAVPGPNGTVQHGLQLVPFMFGLNDSDDVTISLANVITRVKTRDEIKQAYIKETTGIEAPGPTLVV